MNNQILEITGLLSQTQNTTNFRIQTLPDFSISFTHPLPPSKFLPQAHCSLHGFLRAIVRLVNDPHLHRFLRPNLNPTQQNVAHRLRRPDLRPRNGGEAVGKRYPEVHLRHVEDPAVAPHEYVVVRHGEDESGSGSVAGDGGAATTGRSESNMRRRRARASDWLEAARAHRKSKPLQKNLPCEAVTRAEPSVAWDLTSERASRREERSVGLRRCCSSSSLVNVRMKSDPRFSNVHIAVLCCGVLCLLVSFWCGWKEGRLLSWAVQLRKDVLFLRSFRLSFTILLQFLRWTENEWIEIREMWHLIWTT